MKRTFTWTFIAVALFAIVLNLPAPVGGGGAVIISPGGGSGSASTNNVTLTGNTVARTNLLVAVPSISVIGNSNVLEVVDANTNKVFELNRTNGTAYFGSNVNFATYQTNVNPIVFPSTATESGLQIAASGTWNIAKTIGNTGLQITSGNGGQIIATADGGFRAVAGVATTGVGSTNAIAATGWTNTSVFNRHVMLTVTASAFQIKNLDAVIVYNSAAALTATICIPLQPGAAVIGASGLSGTALPW